MAAELPFSQLTWAEFEDLIVALAREADGLVEVSRYGDGGQGQDGVDVIGFTRAGRRAWAYQCKRVARFTESDLSKAVAEFAGGARPFNPVRFVVAVAVPVRRKQVLDRLVAERGKHPDLELLLWDAPVLSELLRGRPRIVERFFGKDTARAFCLSGSFSLAASPDDACPYPGLAPFGPEQARWFFGRDAVLAEICQRLDGLMAAEGPLIVVGPSGAGKSSLVRAGVVPALGEGRLPISWPCVLMTPTARPMRALAEQMSAATGADPAGRAVLLVDQFEQVFTLCTDEQERSEFIDALIRLADHPASSAGPSALVMICLRADFYGQCLRYAGLRTALEARSLPLGPMSECELREAITGPAEAAGLQVEPGLTELLLRDGGLTGQAEDQAARLPLIAHALRATWQQRQSRFLTVDGYRMTGGVRKAVATTAEGEYSLLDLAGQRLAKVLFLRLVKVGDGTVDVCRPARRDELLQDLPDSARAADIMDRFTRARLLAQGRDTVTIAHEALLSSWPRLSGWIADGRDDHLMRQQLDEATGAWDRERDDASGLYRGKRLRAALAWAGEHQADLGTRAREFLAASRRRHRRVRAMWLVTAATAAALAVAVAATSAIAVSAHEADARKAAQDTYDQVIREARRAAAGNPQLATQLYLAAYRMRHSAAVASRLIALENTPLYSPLPVAASVVTFGPGGGIFATGGKSVQLWEMTGAGRARPLDRPFSAMPAGGVGDILAMAFDGSGGVLAVIGQGKLWLWDVSDPAHPRPLRVIADFGPGLAHAVAFSPGGTLLAVAYGNAARGAARLWSVADPAHPRELGPPLATSFGAADSVAFSPDGHTLAIGDNGGYVRLWNVTRPASPTPIGRQLDVDPEASSVDSLAFSPDGAVLAAGASSSGVHLWNVSTPTRPYSLGALAGCHDGWGSAAFSPDNLLVTGCAGSSAGNSVQLWNAASPAHPTPASLPRVVTPYITALAVSPDDRTLVIAGRSGPVLLATIPPVMLNDGQVTALAYDPQRGILASAASGGHVRLWTIDGPAGPRPLGPPLRAPGEAIGSLAFSRDGSLLASGGSGSVRYWLLSDLKRSFVLRTGPGVGIWSVAFSPQDHILAAGDGTGSAQLWNLAHPDRPRELRKVSGGAAVAFSSDGSVLATGDAAGLVRLWLVSNPARPHLVGKATAAPFSGVSSLAFSPRGHVLVSSAHDGTVQLWNVAHLARPRPLGQPLSNTAGSQVAVAFTTHGAMLTIAGRHGSVQEWHITNPASPQPNGQPLTFSANPALTFAGEGMLTPLALAGATVITGSTSGGAWLWDVHINHAIKRICAIPGSELTPAQWHRYIPQLPYTPACPQ